MKLELHAPHFDSFFNEMAHNLSLPEHSHEQEELVIPLPEHMGTGEFRRTRLRHGMEIGWSNILLHEKVVMDVGVRYPHMELAFTMQGSGSWCQQGKSQERDLKGGSGSLIYLNDAVFHAEQHAGQRMDHMEIRIDFMMWRHLIDLLPWQPDASFYCMQNTISPRVSAIVEEMRSCPYTGRIKQLFLEGKCFELLAIYLHEAGGVEKEEQEGLRLKRTDMEALRQARDILDHAWRQPPSLLQLARKVGLNDFKLKSGFKELFGTTVFGYVRQQRMREARLLLEQGRVNVTEAAYLVGYSNLSHFSALFHRTFGHYPSDLTRRSR